MVKNKHLTLTERFIIANLLDKQSSFKAIGVQLGKDCTTILKEVRNHRIPKRTGVLGRAFNNCSLRKTCDHRKLCSGCTSNRYCWTCKKCGSICRDFVEEKCPALLSAPYVCYTEYRAMLSEAVESIPLSECKFHSE